MDYNFSNKETKKRGEMGTLQALKKEYHKQQMSEEQRVALQWKMEEAKMMNKKEYSNRIVKRVVATVAVAAAGFVILPNTSATIAYGMSQIPVIGSLVDVVTFRDYQYEDDRNRADMNIPELKLEVEDSNVNEKLQQTTEEINAEIQSITTELIDHFETYLQEEMGYQDVIVKSEVLATAENYFTLKLICYQGAGSSYQWNYYYTIDLTTGERMVLKDVFKEDADYITRISENIKEQMKQQMEEDENKVYWLEDEIEELNFTAITEDVFFYLNENGNVVIGFNEGDVAPMYMGAVEFEIPAEVLSDIRK